MRREIWNPLAWQPEKPVRKWANRTQGILMKNFNAHSAKSQAPELPETSYTRYRKWGPIQFRKIIHRSSRIVGSRSGSKKQSGSGARANRDCNSSSERIRSNALPLRIFSHGDNADGALAEWRTVFERSGDVIHFSDDIGRVGNFLNQSEIPLIGDVFDLKMVNAVGGLRCGAGWLGAVVIGPTRGYIRSKDFGTENAPRKKDHASSDK